MKVLLASPESA
ncbi:MAG: hypothetical protein QG637_678, partial [Chloroflexota bacterium]|nr:hypothetical protein [Chloroflexota bacterium]